MITQIRQEKQTSGDPLTERIIGCCFRVHRELGPGFPEKIYTAALVMALRALGFSVEQERRFGVTFNGTTVGEFRIDVLVDQRVVVETKAVTGVMPKVFGDQVLAYLKAAGLPTGLLVNFGNASCQVRRLANSSAKSVSKSAESIEQSAKSVLRAR